MFNSQETTLAPPTPTSEPPEPEHFQHTMADKDFTDLLELHTLPFKTGLYHNSWPNDEPVQDFSINARLQNTIMQRGLDIAKQTVWFFLQHNHPSKCRAYFPGGWVDVRFGRKELNRSIGEEDAPSSPDWSGCRTWRYRQNQPELVQAMIYDMISFRNAVSHYSTGSYSGLLVIDGWLEDVQRLAIELYDEERALAVRQLRDELRQAVADTTAAIEVLEPLAMLPFAKYRWEASHEAMFRLVNDYMYEHRFSVKSSIDGDEFPVKVPAAVIRAAGTWTRGDHQLQEPAPGLEKPAGREKRQRRASHCGEAQAAAFFLVPARLARTSTHTSRTKKSPWREEAEDLASPGHTRRP